MKKAIALLFLAAAAPLYAQTLSLDECKALSHTNAPELRKAALDISSSKEQTKEAFWAYLPSVKASAMSFQALQPLVSIGIIDILGDNEQAWTIKNEIEDYASQTGIKTRYEALSFGYGANISAIQPIFAGGRIVNGNSLAKLGVKASEIQYDMKSRESDAAIEEKYWTVISLEEKLSTLDSALHTLDTLRKDLGSAVVSGLVEQSELSNLDLKISELKTARIKLRSGIRLAKMDLLNTIGYPYKADGIDSVVLSDKITDLPEPYQFRIPDHELASKMEESGLLDLQVEAKELEQKMVFGENLPQVGLAATYGYGKYVGEPKGNGAVLLTVSVPITDWGKNSHKIQRARNELEKARIDRDYLKGQLILKANQMWIELESGWEELSAASQAHDIAAANFSKAEAGYNAGLITMGDLLQSQMSLRQSLDALSDARISYQRLLTAYIHYLD